jgi:tetratricopeptide (TPR) repeat protein
MNDTVKIVIYIVLVICAIGFGYGFYHHYSRVTSPPSSPAATNEAPAASTNAPPAQRSGNNAVMMSYAAGLLAATIALGLRLASDFTGFFAGRVEKFIFDEDVPAEKDPEYEEAERVWANGNHLEAVQLMREYLKAHPREQYVALRIAEIYEKDLGNHVAAALEYEEILKKNLTPERWGWAAVHLSNLYSGKLNKTAEAEALLRRIITEHPQTAAAKKARERLGEPEPVIETPLPPEQTPGSNQPGAPPSKLPPGFRPK